MRLRRVQRFGWLLDASSSLSHPAGQRLMIDVNWLTICNTNTNSQRIKSLNVCFTSPWLIDYGSIRFFFISFEMSVFYAVILLFYVGICLVRWESEFNTSAIGSLNADGSLDHGLFQISDLFWCAADEFQAACGVTCEGIYYYFYSIVISLKDNLKLYSSEGR